MNKKVKKKKEVKYDGTEDLEIKHVAYSNNIQQYVLLIILIILFGFTFFQALVYIGNYYEKKELEKNDNVVEIIEDKTKTVISNNGEIYKTLTIKDDNNHEDVILENVNKIEIISENTEEVIKKYFDIRYTINRNDFPRNFISTNDSDLLVRFSYSFDNESWTYLTNAITIGNTNISPVIGALYDLSGLTGNIRVATDYEVSSNPYENVTMYWKCETIFKYKEENLNKTFQAEFKINYKDN